MASYVSNGSISISGNKIIIDGKVLDVSGLMEDLPDVNETVPNVDVVEINGDDVSLEPGDVFKAVGKGYLRKSYGSKVTLENFTGALIIPSTGKLEIKVNSGTVRGQANEQGEVNLKANAGNISLNLRNREKILNIEAKSNAGSINITVL